MIPATLEHWTEWREKCAIAKCASQTSAALRDYVEARFSHYATQAIGKEAAATDLPDSHACFAMLEQWASVARPRTGRRYKEWLFARTEGNPESSRLTIVNSGIALLVRTVVRNWLTEYIPRSEVSLDAPVPGMDTLTFVDLIPDEQSMHIEEYMLRELAESLADEAFKAMKRPVRLVMLARTQNLPLYHPRLLNEFGFGKSKASETWKSVLTNIANSIKEKWPEEPISWKKNLAMFTFDALDQLLVQFDANGRLRARMARLARA